MGVEKLEIHLDDPEYFPGSTLTGIVTLLKSKEEIKTTGITVKFDGLAETYWFKYAPHARGSTNKRYLPYSGEEILFCEKIYVFGSGKDEETLPENDTELRFPFSFQIPDGFPATIIMKNYSINYAVKAKIEFPKEESKSSSRSISSSPCIVNMLSAPLDLNTVPGVELPERTHFEYQSYGCCCFCPRRRIKMELNCFKRGFATEEVIPIDIYVLDEPHRRKFPGFHAYLVRVWTLTAFENGDLKNGASDEKLIVEKILEVSKGVRQRHSKEEGAGNMFQLIWHFNLELPNDLTPTIQDGICEIVKMGYMIHVIPKNVGWGTCCMPPQVAKLPLIIGDVPLMVLPTPSQSVRKSKKEDDEELHHQLRVII